jgi:hypothetical protein
MSVVIEKTTTKRRWKVILQVIVIQREKRNNKKSNNGPLEIYESISTISWDADVPPENNDAFKLGHI